LIVLEPSANAAAFIVIAATRINASQNVRRALVVSLVICVLQMYILTRTRCQEENRQVLDGASRHVRFEFAADSPREVVHPS